MTAKKLSKAQLDALRYFANAQDRNEARRSGTEGPAKLNIRHPDPRPIHMLSDAGLIEVIGYNYGPLFAPSAAGRDLLKTLGH